MDAANEEEAGAFGGGAPARSTLMSLHTQPR